MKLFKSIILSTLFLINPVALFGDDESDVMEVIKTWASLEGDLNKQAELIRDDRVLCHTLSNKFLPPTPPK